MEDDGNFTQSALRRARRRRRHRGDDRSSGLLEDHEKGHEALGARFTKRAAHILLISAFALSVFSIFATTVTGTMLKSLGDRDIVEGYEETISPMGFLHKNLPFEG